MINPENLNRLVQIVNRAEQDKILPEDYIQRLLRLTIGYGNPFIKPDDEFVVLGFDGSDGCIFACGSFKTVEEAKDCLNEKNDEEILYSDGDELSTTFYIFTKNGVHVPCGEI